MNLSASIPENEKDLVINNLIARNEELMRDLQELEDPQRTLLVVSHDEDKENKWVQVLAMLYKTSFEDRLAFSEVKDKEGKVHMALCAVGDGEKEGDIFLFPLFTVNEVNADEEWKFPAPGGKWMGAGDAIEAPLALQ